MSTERRGRRLAGGGGGRGRAARHGQRRDTAATSRGETPASSILINDSKVLIT